MIGRRFAAEAALVSAAFFFGATFPLVHRALHDMTPFGFLTLRFAVALVCLGPFAVAVARRTDADRRILVRVGLVSGLLLFGGFATQTVGLRTTAPATSAFLTGLYVMFTPFVEGVVQRRVPPPRVLGSAGLALVGPHADFVAAQPGHRDSEVGSSDETHVHHGTCHWSS